VGPKLVLDLSSKNVIKQRVIHPPRRVDQAYKDAFEACKHAGPGRGEKRAPWEEAENRLGLNKVPATKAKQMLGYYVLQKHLGRATSELQLAK